MGFFSMELFDRPTSRGQVGSELLVHSALVRDGVSDAEQEIRGSGELQVELLVCFIR